MSQLTRFWLDRLSLMCLSPHCAKLRWAHHCTSPLLRIRGQQIQPRRPNLPAHLPRLGLPRRQPRHPLPLPLPLPLPHCEPLLRNLLLLLHPVHLPRPW